MDTSHWVGRGAVLTRVPDKIGPRCPPGGDCPKVFETSASRCPVCDAPLHHDYRGHNLDNRFEVLDLIGVGGMGFVYKARQIAMDRHRRNQGFARIIGQPRRKISA